MLPLPPDGGLFRHSLTARRRAVGRAVAAAVTLAASVLGVSSPAAAQTQPFTDTAQDAYYSDAVDALADGGIFDGTECAQAMLCPGEPMDRKTMRAAGGRAEPSPSPAVWTVRALDGQDPAPIANSRFSDVAADSFHGPFIERMAELEVTTGCGDGTGFCPDDTVTRAHMAVFLTRAFELDPGPDPGFSDVAPDAWYHDQVAALAASAITAGCGDGTAFCPGRQTTRAQMATFLARATGLIDLPTQPPTTTPTATYTTITTGRFHTCALRTDNTITCWGNNRSGQTDAPDGQYTTITAGTFHTCALRTDNTITCWGNNGWGETDAPDGQYTTITAGDQHTCALRTDNTITCWGNNDVGQSDAPDGQYTTITAGTFHTCALRTDNTITCWGRNTTPIGYGNSIISGQSDAPDGQYTTITTGRFHTCALHTDNTITCWGWNDVGQANAPDGQYTTITAGTFHTCALRTDNTITCWGRDWVRGSLGYSWGLTDAPDGQYTTITTGNRHTCALRTDNTITCWGWNDVGQSDAPDGQYTTITAGIFHTCALRTDNTITCWGANQVG